MANYLLGDITRVPVEFRNADTGVLVDPGQVRAKVQNPQLAITTHTHPTTAIVKDAVGQYHIDVLLNKPGEWHVRWEGSASNQAAEETSVFAHESAFYNKTGGELPDS